MIYFLIFLPPWIFGALFYLLVWYVFYGFPTSSDKAVNPNYKRRFCFAAFFLFFLKLSFYLVTIEIFRRVPLSVASSALMVVGFTFGLLGVHWSIKKLFHYKLK